VRRAEAVARPYHGQYISSTKVLSFPSKINEMRTSFIYLTMLFLAASVFGGPVIGGPVEGNGNGGVPGALISDHVHQEVYPKELA